MKILHSIAHVSRDDNDSLKYSSCASHFTSSISTSVTVVMWNVASKKSEIKFFIVISTKLKTKLLVLLREYKFNGKSYQMSRLIDNIFKVYDTSAVILQIKKCFTGERIFWLSKTFFFSTRSLEKLNKYNGNMIKGCVSSKFKCA